MLIHFSIVGNIPESSCLSNDKADMLGALETLLSEVSIKTFVRFIVLKISIEKILSRLKLLKILVCRSKFSNFI